MTIRLQSTQLTEVSLSNRDETDSGCLKRMLCSIGVMRSGLPAEAGDYLFPRISLGRGVEDFKKILEVMVADLSKADANSAGSFPNIYQTLGR